MHKWSNLFEAIEDENEVAMIKENFPGVVKEIKPLEKTHSGTIYLINGDSIAKFAHAQEVSMSNEAAMLSFLSENNVRVPEVTFCNEELIIMDYIEEAVPQESKEQILALAIANLHSINGRQYGFCYDGAIGDPAPWNWSSLRNRIKIQGGSYAKKEFQT